MPFFMCCAPLTMMSMTLPRWTRQATRSPSGMKTGVPTLEEQPYDIVIQDRHALLLAVRAVGEPTTVGAETGRQRWLDAAIPGVAKC